MDEDVVSARATLRNVVVISKNLEWPPSSFKVASTKSTSVAFDALLFRAELFIIIVPLCRPR